MVTKKSKSELALLEQYRVGLANTKAQARISENMALYGYAAEKMAEGQQKYDTTLLVFNANKLEDDETSAASDKFKKELAEIEEIYRLDRKKARIVFRSEPLILKRLGIVGLIPDAYVNLLQTIKTYYAVALADAEISSKLAVLNTTSEHFSTVSNKIIQLEQTRLDYLREVGESQEATLVKDKAFAELDEWMREFYAVAKIAMEEEPQLLESIGILVKN